MMSNGRKDAGGVAGRTGPGPAKASRSILGSGSKSSLLMTAGSVILVAALAAAPLRGQKAPGKSPAADAEAIRRTLAMQAEQHFQGEGEASATADSTESASRTAPAYRDLFNPVRVVRQATVRRADDAPPRLPRLSGVFLDGGNRLAVLDGGTAGEGDEVLGFLVLSILPDMVIVEREGQTYTLEWKGVQP